MNDLNFVCLFYGLVAVHFTIGVKMGKVLSHLLTFYVVYDPCAEKLHFTIDVKIIRFCWRNNEMTVGEDSDLSGSLVAVTSGTRLRVVRLGSCGGCVWGVMWVVSIGCHLGVRRRGVQGGSGGVVRGVSCGES